MGRKSKGGGGGTKPRDPDGGSSAGVAVLAKLHAKFLRRAEALARDGGCDDANRTPTATHEDLAPSTPGFVVVTRGVLSPDECDALRDCASQAGLNPPSEADLHPRKGEALVDRFKLSFSDDNLRRFLERRLRGLGCFPAVPGREPVGLHPTMRYYRYERQQVFERHVDQAVRGERSGEETEYTCLLYLNGDGGMGELRGGATVFHATVKRELCRVEPELGAVCMHAHGRRCLLHESEAVQRGVKWVLRGDVLYRRTAS